LKRKHQKQLENYLELLTKAAPVFDMCMYHTDFVTCVPDATALSETNSYFVMKDTDGKVNGEYCLATGTNLLTINKYLWMYLIKRLSLEVY